MNAHSDLDQQLDSFLREGPTELPYQSFDAVRDRTEQTRQRVLIGPWRTPTMNKFATIALGAGAVVVALIVGVQLLSSPNNGPNVGNEPTATPEPSEASWSGLPAGPYLVTGEDGPVDGGPVPVTVDITSSGWNSDTGFDYVYKDDDGRAAPETVGAALIAWSWPAETGFYVYRDPCHWSTSLPGTPATTPDEIAAAFADQASTDATSPVDVTVGGYSGKAITVQVPMSYDLSGSDSEDEFAVCDQKAFAFYGTKADGSDFARNAQGAGQIEEFWFLDVDGSTLILDLSYSPATPDELVEEMRTLAASATFETP